VCPKLSWIASTALARTSCRTAISAFGRFSVSKNTGSAATSHRIFSVVSPPVKALNRVPGALVGTLAGVIVGMAQSSTSVVGKTTLLILPIYHWSFRNLLRIKVLRQRCNEKSIQETV